MLHQTHQLSNATNCWVCGKIPPHQNIRGIPLSPLPFSHNGSCQPWFKLLYASKVLNLSETWEVRDLNTKLNKACYPNEDGDPQAKGTALEMEEYSRGSAATNYVYPNFRSARGNGPPVISVALTAGPLCVQSTGDVPVGHSNCTTVLQMSTRG